LKSRVPIVPQHVTRLELSIIGYGRFGRLAAHYLKRRFEVCVYSHHKIQRLEKGIRSVDLEHAASKPVVVLAVPINQLPSVLRSISPLLQPGAVVCDVCSVKEEPVKWMKQILPSNVSILGTHPLFGPDSASKNLTGRNIVLCPVRIPKKHVARTTAGLRGSGLHVSVMSPAAHDRLMARTLFLTQFVGRTVAGLADAHVGISTRSFDLLLELTRTASNDSLELFRDMYRYNRFSRKLPKELLSTVNRNIRILKDKQNP
jgi:prephenate dehydrogenase